MKHQVSILIISIILFSAFVYADVDTYEHGSGNWQLTDTRFVNTGGSPSFSNGKMSASCQDGSAMITWSTPPQTATDMQEITMTLGGSIVKPTTPPSHSFEERLIMSNEEKSAEDKILRENAVCEASFFAPQLGYSMGGLSCPRFNEGASWFLGKPENTLTYKFPSLGKVYICSRDNQNSLDVSEEAVDAASRKENELKFDMTFGLSVGRAGEGYVVYSYVWVPANKKEQVTIHGSVSDADDEPLPYSTIIIDIDGDQHVANADKNGDYTITFEKPGNYKEAHAFVKLSYNRDGKNYYNVYYDAGGNDYKEMWAGNKIDLAQNDITANIKIKVGSFEESTFTAPNQIDIWVENSAAIYFHMHEAVDFAIIRLKANIDNKLPVDVWVGNKEGKTNYQRDTTDIYVADAYSVRTISHQPWIEYHEFSHHIMYSLYGANLPGKEVPGSRNHGGFSNPNSADSWSEGFAEFLPMVIAESNGNRQPYVYSTLANNEDNYKAWENKGGREEFAVAGILWDLYDKNNDKGDTVSLMFDDIWNVIKQRREDVSEAYTALITAFPKQADAIGKIFIEHGFFADLAEGNKKRDFFEPFTDANGNGVFDAGDKFIDYGTLNAEKDIVYKQGYVVGKATNYERPTRQFGGVMEDSFLAVPDKDVWQYKISVDYADASMKDYSYTGFVQGGLLYISPLPSDIEATITITPESQDFKSDKPYVIKASELNNKLLLAEGKGSFDTHAFELKPTGSKLDPVAPAGLDKPYIEDDDTALDIKPHLIKSEIGKSSGKSESPGSNFTWLIVIFVVLAIMVIIFIKKFGKKHK